MLPWCTCWVSCSSEHADILLIPLEHLPLTPLPAALWSRQEIPCEVITAQVFTNLSGFCCLYVAKPSPASPRAARKWPAAGACPGRLLHLSSLPQGLLSPPQHRIPLTSPSPPPRSATTIGAAWSQQPLPCWTPENTRQLNCPMLKPKQHTEQRNKQKMKQKR